MLKAAVPDEIEETTRIIVLGRSGLETQGIAASLASEPGMNVLTESSQLIEAERAAATFQFDVVILDSRLVFPVEAGALRGLIARFFDVPVIVLSEARDEDAVMSALGGGARGYLLKSSVSAHLAEAIRAVVKGGMYIDPAVAATVVGLASGRRISGPHGLTPQEIRVLRYLPRGLSNREIASQLTVSEETIKSHVRSILRKLGVSDRARAAAVAMREGIA